MYYASRLDSSSLPIFDITYFSDYKNFSEIKRFIPIWSYLNIILISRERKICSSRSHLLKRQFTYLYLNPLSYIHGCNLNKIEFLTFLPIPNSICVSILFFFFLHLSFSTLLLSILSSFPLSRISFLRSRRRTFR